jgi:hypothetical protein
MSPAETFPARVNATENIVPRAPHFNPDRVDAYDMGSFLAALPPFLPAALVALLAEFKARFDAYSAEMTAADEAHFRADWEARVTAARNDPTPENLAALNSDSSDELRRKYEERHRLYSGLRDECVLKYSTPIARQLRPILVRLAGAFRVQVETDFRAVHARYKIAFDASANLAVRGVDRWLSDAQRQLDAHDNAEANRYPSGWESLLPAPGNFASLCGGNLAPASATTSPAPEPGSLRTAADVAAARG